jgi:cell division protein FtsL
MSAHGAAGPHDVSDHPGGEEAEPSARPSRPDLRVVEPRVQAAARRRRRIRFTALGAGGFIAIVVFGLVGVHVMLAQNQFQLDRLNSRSTLEEARYQRLRLEVDQLEAPQRIVATAEGRLGMVPPPAVKYLTPSSRLTSARSSAPGLSAPTVASPSTGIPPAGEGPRDWAAVKPQLVARQ